MKLFRGTRKRRIEPTTTEAEDEMFSQQTDTLSYAIVEVYKSSNLKYEDIIIGKELIAQGRYWREL